jgi:type IV pilus assembly protein PilV
MICPMKSTLISPVPLRSYRFARGFTLLEILVALLIIANGLLGIAGMQALAVNNTSVSRTRSLAALQASSLSSAMGANPAFWAAGLAPANVTVNGTTLSDTTLNSQTTDCSSTACTPVQMAGYDLTQWGRSVAAMLPGGTGQVACTTTAGQPISCVITVFWAEKNLALRQASGTITAGATQNYQMVVQP